MTRYQPAKHYQWFGIAAVLLSAFSGWFAMRFPPAYVPAGLFLLTAAFLFTMAMRPPIEVHEGNLSIDIRRLDRTGWVSPLIVRITLFDDSRLVLLYPGDLDACNSLLRHLRR